MTTHVLVLQSGPGRPGIEQTLGFAQTWLAQNEPVAIALIQDGVLAALDVGVLPVHQRLRAVVHDGARCLYLSEDLSWRGFGPSDTLVGCEPIDVDGLVDQRLADDTRVTGAF